MVIRTTQTLDWLAKPVNAKFNQLRSSWVHFTINNPRFLQKTRANPQFPAYLSGLASQTVQLPPLLN